MGYTANPAGEKVLKKVWNFHTRGSCCITVPPEREVIPFKDGAFPRVLSHFPQGDREK